MRRGLIALTVLMGLGVLLQFGCGGSAIKFSSNAGSGTLAVFGGDAPLCSVLSLQAQVTEVDVVPLGGGSPVPVINSQTAITVDFAALTGFNTILNLSSVPAGSYSQASITLSNPQITILDTTVSPPVSKTIATTFINNTSSVTVTANINPVLTVENGVAQGLILDFNLRKSIQLDASGQVTGVVNPAFRAMPSVITTVKGLGELDEFHGTVQAVSTTSADPNFIGNFTIQRPSGEVFLVNVKSATEFENISGLDGLKPGMFVEVEAFVNDKGNIVAKEVEMEEQEDTSHAVLVGVITSVEPGLGNAAGFNLFVREEYPPVENIVPLRTIVTVNITSGTVFRIAFRAQGVNQAGLNFNASTLTPGQHVAVMVPISGTGPQTTFNALGVLLRLHGYFGNLSGTPTIGSDLKTGGFTFIICSPVLEGQPITVLTFSNSEFEGGLTDLTSLNSTQNLVVKGLLFYQPAPLTVNGVTIASPGWVLEAGEVTEIP